MIKRPAHLLTVATAVLLLATATCSAEPAIAWALVKKAARLKYPSVRQLSTGRLAKWLARADTIRPLLLDVREPEEFAVSHLRGARPTADLQKALRQLGSASVDTPIVVYCSVGFRSSELVQQLQAEGYAHVYNLEGSIFEWANQGRPIYRGEEKVKTVHPYGEPWTRLLQRSLRAKTE